MEQILKQKIATGAADYAKKNAMSNNDVANATGVNAGYISLIFRNQFTLEVGDKTTPIGDSHFYKLASWAAIPVKPEYWKIEQSIQFKEVIAVLMEAKENPTASLIINDTGMGKTSTVDIFCNKVPLHTYRVTVGGSYRLNNIIDEIMQKIGIDNKINNRGPRSQGYPLKQYLDRIAEKLVDIKNAGGKPAIILDEAENLKPAVLQTVKELYDATIQHCSIVLIGTDQIFDSMLNRRNKNRQSVPQVYRRFKAGIKMITPLEKKRDFKFIFDRFKMDKSFQELICSLCDNYGELHDFLEPVIRYAEEKKHPLTEELFRLYHKLPKL